MEVAVMGEAPVEAAPLVRVKEVVVTARVMKALGTEAMWVVASMAAMAVEGTTATAMMEGTSVAARMVVVEVAVREVAWTVPRNRHSRCPNRTEPVHRTGREANHVHRLDRRRCSPCRCYRIALVVAARLEVTKGVVTVEARVVRNTEDHNRCSRIRGRIVWACHTDR